jgi:folate-binding protein YgfZ
MQQWQQFLQDSTAQSAADQQQKTLFDDYTVINFGDPVAEQQALVNATVLCDLSHLGLLQLQGSDALSFLQGQVTNDVQQLTGHNAHYSAYCNPKGRMLALFLAFKHYDHVHLQMPRALTTAIAKRLKMFVMRSKVEIEDVTSSIIKIGLSGPNAAQLLQPLFAQVPQVDYELVSLDNGALLRLPGATARYEIFADLANAKIIWNALKQQATPIGINGWEWLEIQAGIPEVSLNTQEQFVPQMLNLDLLGGINFKKGCYTGQEIVARTHYLGTVKRRTQLAHVHCSSQPMAGDSVVNAADEAVGKVVRSAVSPKEGYDILAEIRLESVQAGDLFINASALHILPMPYAL